MVLSNSITLNAGIASTKKGENKRLIVFSFLLIVLFSGFVSLFGAVLVKMIKPGLRAHNENEIHHGDSSQGSRDIKQMISSQDEAIYDVLMYLKMI